MYVCMYVYMYVCMHACIYVHNPLIFLCTNNLTFDECVEIYKYK